MKLWNPGLFQEDAGTANQDKNGSSRGSLVSRRYQYAVIGSRRSWEIYNKLQKKLVTHVILSTFCGILLRTSGL